MSLVTTQAEAPAVRRLIAAAIEEGRTERARTQRPAGRPTYLGSVR